MYLGFRCGRAVVTRGFSVCLDFEKQIQTKEITHEALTNRRMAVRKRSPLSLAATQTALRVITRHTISVNNVEIAILESFLTKENSVSDGRGSSRKLHPMELQDEDSRQFLAVFVNDRNSFLTRETHRLDQKPKSLPKNRDPMYSNCHSGQGGIN